MEFEERSQHPDDGDPVIAAYFRIASRGHFSPDEAGELARRLGLTTAACAQVVGRLQELGLLAATSDPGRFRPAHPRVASAILLALAESALERRKHALPLPADGGADFATAATVTSVRAVRAQIEELAGSPDSEIMSCYPGGGRPSSALAGALARDLTLLARGVTIRMLYQHTSRFHMPTQAYASATMAAGSQIRTLPDLPPLMIIIDRSAAFLPHRDHADATVVVRDASIVAHLCTSFEQAWNLGSPYKTGPAGARQSTDELKTSIVRLLANGMKDEVVAKRLGLSVRSVRGHVAQIMSQLGAGSRFQAGVHAVHSEWLAADVAGRRPSLPPARSPRIEGSRT